MVTADRNGDTITFAADADMDGLTLVLHGIGGESKAEGGEILADAGKNTVSIAVSGSTRKVTVTIS